MTTALWLGLVLGIRHALDADHVVAISSLVARERRLGAAATIGAYWAAGHGSTLLAVGLAAMWFDLRFPALLGEFAELGVGVLLVGLGLANLWASRRPIPDAPPTSGARRSLAMGGMHGLAGSGVVVVIAVQALPTPAAVASYLLAFGAGTALGMVACSALLGAPLARLDGPRARRTVHAVTGFASVGIGALLLTGLPILPSLPGGA